MILLDRYIMRNYAVGMVPVLLLLLALFSFVALADELEQVGQGAFTAFDAVLVVFYTMPRRIVDLLPVTALMGGLMGLGAMANHQELIAARAAGLSKARMARPVFLTALMVAIAVVAMQSWLVPQSELEAADLRARSLVNDGTEVAGQNPFWTWSGQRIVHVGGVRFNRILTGVEIYEMDASGKLDRLIEADRATITGADTWLLDSVRHTRLDGMHLAEQFTDSEQVTGLLTESQAESLVLPVEVLSPHDLVRNVRYLSENGLDTHHFRVIFWQQFSLPFAVVALGLLSLAMLSGSTRSRSAGQRILTGGLVGIAFYFLQQLTAHLAGLFGLPPGPVIMAPVLGLLALAVAAQYWRRA